MLTFLIAWLTLAVAVTLLLLAVGRAGARADADAERLFAERDRRTSTRAPATTEDITAVRRR